VGSASDHLHQSGAGEFPCGFVDAYGWDRRGIVASLQLAWRLGGTFCPSRLGAQFVGATLPSAFFALWAYVDPATIGLAGAMGLMGWARFGLVSAVLLPLVPGLALHNDLLQVSEPPQDSRSK
jgi:hypothetical protein